APRARLSPAGTGRLPRPPSSPSSRPNRPATGREAGARRRARLRRRAPAGRVSGSRPWARRPSRPRPRARPGAAGPPRPPGGAGLAVGLALGRDILHGSSISDTNPIHLAPQIGSGSQSSGPIDAQAIASRVDPAVVDINTVVAGLRGSARAAGTGMILTPSGE